MKGEDFFDISIESIFYDTVRNEDVFPLKQMERFLDFYNPAKLIDWGPNRAAVFLGLKKKEP